MAVTLTSLLLLLAGVGCNQSSAPPPPLSVDQLPAAFATAFQQAPAEVKDLAHEVVTAVQGQDYAKAYLDLEKLTGQSGLTPAQARVATRALLTVNDRLHAAQAQGDAQAAAVLKFQHMTK